MAVIFDGANDYFNCGSDPSIDGLFDAGGSIAGWLNPDTYGEGQMGNLARKGWVFRPRNEGGVWIEQVNFYHSFNVGGNPGVWRCDWPGVGSRIHLVLTFDNSNAANDPIIYVNGVSKAITEVNVPAGVRDSDAAANLIIGGAGDGSETFDGKMGGLRFYKKILNQGEVDALVAGYLGSLGGEVAWYDMCSAQGVARFPGAVLANGVNLLTDRSGNGNDGDPTGNPVGHGEGCGGITPVRFFT